MSTAQQVMQGVRGIVFDKDGTLLDLDARWAPLFNTLIERLAQRCSDPSLVAHLTGVLGIDGERLIADGPAAVDTASQIIGRVVEELVARGFDAAEAQDSVNAVVAASMDAVGPIEAIGDFVGALRAMRSAGLRVGVATSDDRANTITELTDLGAIDLIDAFRCADDGGPVKPDPGVLTGIAAEWGCDMSELVFVGDSRNDMVTARSAGCSFVVRCELDRAPEWAVTADAIVASIEELVPSDAFHLSAPGAPGSPATDDGPDGRPGAWAQNGAVRLWWQHFAGQPGATRLLLVNGLGSPSVSYQLGFVERLIEAGFEVVRFDNRDVGRSSRVGVHYDAHDMAEDAVAVLDAAGWASAVVFGQSMGGMIAQQLVIDHPERATHLVSLMSSTGNRTVGASDPSVRDALVAVAPDDRDGWLDHRVATERYWASPDLWDPEWVRSKGAEMFDHGVDPVGVQRQYQAVLASPVRDEMLADVVVPTLVLHGTSDTLIDASAGRHTASCVPGAVFIEVDGLGHDLPPGFWDRLVTEVSRFVLA